MHILSGFIALLVLLPIVVLLGWLEHRADDDGVECMPQRNTWTREDIDA